MDLLPSRMRLLLLCGLVLFGLCQRALARGHKNVMPQSEDIVAPDPEDDLIISDGTSHPLVDDNESLCANMADNSLLPYIGNCSKYISCIGGKIASHGSCYEGDAFQDLCGGKAEGCEVVFDYKFQACSYASPEIKCLPECESYNLTSFCYDGTCTRYVLCYYGIPVLRECYDGLQYNAETDRCDFPQYVDCVENECPQERSVSNILYLPSKAHCSKYFICSDGMAWPQECSSGLAFNPECDCCDYASKVNCTASPQQRNILPYSRSPPRRADVVCPAKGVHFYPHKSRLDAYYYCVEGHGVTLDCTPGLLYDSQIHECRDPKYIAR